MTDVRNDLDPDGWVDRHGELMFRYAVRMVRARDVAEDVVQETFLEALRSHESYAGRSSERTWLVGILRHKILDYFRKSGRELLVDQVERVGENANGIFDRRGHWKVGPARWNGDPAQDLERQEFWDVLRQCLSALPPGLSETFFLYELEGLDGAEVCEVLGITPANLWKRMHRCRLLLRECLERNWFGTPAKRVETRRSCEGC
jgi:RNA polymerase sigma-70 factor, ECF subfamily